MAQIKINSPPICFVLNCFWVLGLPAAIFKAVNLIKILLLVVHLRGCEAEGLATINLDA